MRRLFPYAWGVVFVLCISFGLYNFKKKSQTPFFDSRTPHSRTLINTKACLTALKSFFKDWHSTILILQKFPTKFKVEYFKYKLSKSKEFNRSSSIKQLVREINFAVQNKIINEKQADEILSKVPHIRKDYFLGQTYKVAESKHISDELELLKGYIDEKRVPNQDLTDSEQSKHDLAINELKDSLENVLNKFKSQELFMDTQTLKLGSDEIQRAFSKVKANPVNINLLAKYLDYLSFQNTPTFMDGVKALYSADDIYSSSNKVMKKFVNIHKKQEKKYNQEYKKVYSKLNKKNPDATHNEIDLEAKKAAKEKSEIFAEKLKLCRASGRNQKTASANKSFLAFSAFYSAALNGGSYAFTSNNKGENLNFKRLTYEVLTGLALGFLRGNFYRPSNSSTTALLQNIGLSGSATKTYTRMYIAELLLDIVWTGMYPSSISSKDLSPHEKLEHLQDTPEKKARIQKIIEYIQNSNIQEQIEIRVSQIQLSIEGISDERAREQALREHLLHNLSDIEYEVNRGFFNLGSRKKDLYAFESAWGVAGVAQAMALANLNYQILCVRGDTQKEKWASYAKAVLLNTTVLPVSLNIYYHLRQDAIGF